MSLKNVHHTAWTSMLSRICDTWTRKNSREIHLHFTSLNAASAMARINEYGGTVLRCLYSRDQQTMFMVVAEPEFALNEICTNSATEPDEVEDCQHDEHDHGYCLDCEAYVAESYEYEHDSNDMER